MISDSSCSPFLLREFVCNRYTRVTSHLYSQNTNFDFSYSPFLLRDPCVTNIMSHVHAFLMPDYVFWHLWYQMPKNIIWHRVFAKWRIPFCILMPKYVFEPSLPPSECLNVTNSTSHLNVTNSVSLLNVTNSASLVTLLLMSNVANSLRHVHNVANSTRHVNMCNVANTMRHEHMRNSMRHVHMCL